MCGWIFRLSTLFYVLILKFSNKYNALTINEITFKLKEEFKELESDLRQAASRGVNVPIIAYGEIASDFANVYLHYIGHEIAEEYGGRWIVISADDSEVVAGIVSLGKDSRASWTRHIGLVMPITEVMIHDLYLMEIMEKT